MKKRYEKSVIILTRVHSHQVSGCSYVFYALASDRRSGTDDEYIVYVGDPDCNGCADYLYVLVDEVERVVNEAYPGFSDRLRLLLPRISAKEKQVSLLLKAQ